MTAAIPDWAAGWLGEIAELGWREARAAGAAARAGLSVAELFEGGDRHDALAELSRHADRAMRAVASLEGSPRDRLFDLAMARFDALQPWREAVRRALRARDPMALAQLGWGGAASLRRMGEAAGLDMGGLAGPWRAAALGAVLAQVSRIWLDDESPDLSATMAELDRRLDEAQRFLGLRPSAARDVADESG